MTKRMEIPSGDLINKLHTIIDEYKNENGNIHPYDIAELLLELRDLDNEKYLQIIKEIPHELFADVLAEMPEYVQEEIGEYLSLKDLADITAKMDTDDAADFIQTISDENEEIAQDILDSFDTEEKKMMEQLISYEDDEAGAYMQTELFQAELDETIDSALLRLKELKESNVLDNVWHCHIVDGSGHYVGSVGLEELIIFDRALRFKDIPEEKLKEFSVNHKAKISEVVEIFTNYNLSTLPVVDDKYKLIGRITSDDIYDVIEENATEQIYNMAGVSEDAEQEEDIFEIGKSRAIWLGVNLMTAIAASLVIGMFDATIQSIVALAVLMPIVASMGGNAGTQTLTVTVRQMALGDIEGSDAKKTIMKEVMLSLINGFIFAIVIGLIAYIWFKMPMLGVVIALSMIVNLLAAGFFGASIPLALKKLNIDPAIGSTVLLTTVTDVVGFFSFLGLATMILL
jgi:magnesium transporter